MTVVLCWLLGSYAVVLALAYHAARKLFRESVAAWGGPHEYRQADPASFPALSEREYERVREELKDLGFRRVARLENITLSKAYPALRTLVDAYVGERGDVYAATYEVPHPRLGQQALDFETTFGDGSFLITTNAEAAASMTSPSSIERLMLPRVEEPAKLLAAHSQRLGELRAGGKTGEEVQSLNDVLRVQRAFSETESAYRRTIGYLTRGEFLAMAKGPLFLPGSLSFLYWLFKKQVEEHQKRIHVV
jgi:hypothetical protein